MSALRGLAVAVAFLTRVRAPDGPPALEEVGRSIAFFPLVGVALGAGLAMVAAVLTGRVPAALAAPILVAALALVTGGLHLDGVADVFDGLGGGAGDRERTLELMRDSRIGAHGASALFLVLAAKIAALAAVLVADRMRAVVVFPAIARWAVVPLLVGFPYARDAGLGRAFNQFAGAREVVIASLVALVLAVWAGALAASLLAGVVAFGFGAWLTRRLGGLTGDVYGAAIELAEVTFLAVIAATS